MRAEPMQSTIHGSRIKTEAVLFAFDLLELDGEDLRPMPIEARKRKLAQLVRNAGFGLHLCEHLHGDGMEIFKHACTLGCEGISKRVGSRYESSTPWNAPSLVRVASMPSH
jgi:bifunctional non-homologous end joining protein LigD